MKHFLIVLIVAVITITIVFVIYRPDLLEDIWLWIIGLIGPIIGIVRKGLRSLSKLFKIFD